MSCDPKLPNIPKNQVLTINTITQREHEDDAAARRSVLVDECGNPINEDNPLDITGDINVVVNPADTPVIANIPVALANTEALYAFPAGTSRFTLKVREGNAIIRYAWIAGDSGTDFITLPYGNQLDIRDVILTGKTIYFQLSKAGMTVEIESWS